MFSYFYIFFFSHGRSVVSLSHLYLVLSLSLSSRFVVLCFLGTNKKCSSRPPRVLYGSSDDFLLQNEREKSGKSISRKYLIRCSLFDSFAISGSVCRSSARKCGASLHTLFSCARSLASRWKKEKVNENKRGNSFSWESFFLFAICWLLGIVVAGIFWVSTRSRSSWDTKQEEKRMRKGTHTQTRIENVQQKKKKNINRG